MLKPKEDPTSRSLEGTDGIEPGMDEILRSIRGILGEDDAGGVRFPEPDAGANDAAVPQDLPSGPPLAFLRRKPTPDPSSGAAEAPAMPTLEERLARHRAKADAERKALRELAERASAKTAPKAPAERAADTPPPEARAGEARTGSDARPPELEVQPASDGPNEVAPADAEGANAGGADAAAAAAAAEPVPEFDIFAESEDLTAPPEPPVQRRMRRMELPDIEAEPVDYSGRPFAPAVEVLGPRDEAGVEETFEELARSLLRDKGDDMDGILADMMRPIVREWLDDHLAGIVERVVREEIDRVSRGVR